MANIFPKLVQMTDELPQHRDNVRLSVLFSGPDSRVWSDEDSGPGTRRNASCCSTLSHVRHQKNIVIFRKILRYTLCVKMKISGLAAEAKCRIRLGLLTHHAKNFRTLLTSSMFAILVFASGGRNQLATAVRKPQTWNMNCLNRNQNLRSERMGWKTWYHFTEIVKLQISWRDVSLSLYNCRFREFWMEDWLLIVRNRFSGKDAKSIGLMILCNGVFKGSFLRSGYRVSKWAIGHEYLLRSFQTKSDLNGN